MLSRSTQFAMEVSTLACPDLQNKVAALFRKQLVATDKVSTDLVQIRAKGQAEKLIEVVQLLMSDADRIEDVKQLLSQSVFDVAKGSGEGDDDALKPWPSQYTYWDTIPGYLTFSVLEKRVNAFNAAFVTKLTKAERGVKDKLLEALMSLKTKTRLTHACATRS